MILGIDGGATATKAALMSRDDRLLKRFTAAPSNAVLQSDDEIYSVLKEIQDSIAGLCLTEELEAVSLCLAGVVNKRIELKIKTVASFVWSRAKIFVSHDLMSGLYAGSTEGRGIVAISGTGASVFGRNGKIEIRAGGWGHLLGDGGSGYHIAHMGLRSLTADYDRGGKLNATAQKILKAAGVKTLEELSAYVSRTEKNKIAELSKFIFTAATEGDRSAQKVIEVAAGVLASNVANVARRLKVKNIPVIVTGGIFERQKYFLKVFSRALKKELAWAKPTIAESDGAVGAIRWGLEQLHSGKKTTVQDDLSINLDELEKRVDLGKIATEQRNPRTQKLSELKTRDAVDLYLKEESAVLPALQERAEEISKAVDIIIQGLKNGGRLIYAGAGSSGRLGVLDASECPPTFRSRPGQVIALMAGGPSAFVKAVEGAEDDEKSAVAAVKELSITKNDVVCGVTASGRTPFAIAALKEAKNLGAATLLLSCNPNLIQSLGKNFDIEIHLATGPEVLTGSTRLKAGTATKICLNLFSTLSMVKLGKVKSNFMVDLNPTNEKLKARAVGIFVSITSAGKEKAFEFLKASNWHLRQALESYSKDCQAGLSE